jgi:hypothetical protein
VDLLEYMMPNPREELVQIAAVCLAAAQDLDYGTVITHGPDGKRTDPFCRTLEAVTDARYDQRDSHTLAEWLMILAEEVGELADAAILVIPRFAGGPRAPALDDDDWAAGATIREMAAMGVDARDWLSEHPWPERQQRVVDKERS